MTKNTPNGEGVSAVRVLEIANNHFNRALDELDKIILKMDVAEKAGAQNLAKAIQDMRKATQVLFEERAKVEQLRKKSTGVAYDYAIDLGAARDEVGRRLALLRQAGNSSPISDGPE